MIDIYVQDIRRALENKCYFSALALALTLPDICGAVEFTDGTPVAKRYIGWYDKYVYPLVGDQYDTPNLTGELVYNLRNTFLHQGWPNINSSKIKTEREQVDRFILLLGDGTKLYNWSMHCSVDLRHLGPDAGFVDLRTILVDISYLCGLLSRIATEYYAKNRDKFSFNFNVYTQDSFFSEAPSFANKVKESIERGPLDTILSSKISEKLNANFSIEGVLTKDDRERIKKYLKALLKTVRFYDENAEQYNALTVNADMSKTYGVFLRYLLPGAAVLDAGDGDAAKVNVEKDQISILDAGCGSGRDSLFFMKKGYTVTMLDASAGMCKCAEALTGQKVLHMQFDEIDFEKQFDGIWACASLLHVPEKELETVFVTFWRALKDNGVIYASWKYGEEERYDGERFYCDMTEEKLKNFLARAKTTKRFQDLNLFSETHDREGEGDANLFECLDCWVTEDVLPSGREQKWLNVVLRKGNCHGMELYCSRKRNR